MVNFSGPTTWSGNSSGPAISSAVIPDDVTLWTDPKTGVSGWYYKDSLPGTQSSAKGSGVTPAKAPSAYDMLAKELRGVSMPNINQFRGMYRDSLGSVSPRRVEMTQEEQNAVQLANSLLTGQYGNLKQLLSGTPDMGLLEQAVLDPSRRNLKEQVIPGIEQAFSGGPYGGSYNSGARREAVSRAYSDEATRRAQAMQAETALAKQLGLEATKVVPALAEVAGTGRRVEEGNVTREMQATIANMEARFKEAGLDQGAMDRAINTTKLALEKAGMLWQAKSSDEKLTEEMRQFDTSMAFKEKELQANLNLGYSKINNEYNAAVLAQRAKEQEFAAANEAAGAAYASALGGISPNADPMTNMWNIIYGGAKGFGSAGAYTAAYSTLYNGSMNMYQLEMEAKRNQTSGSSAPVQQTQVGV